MAQMTKPELDSNALLANDLDAALHMLELVQIRVELYRDHLEDLVKSTHGANQVLSELNNVEQSIKGLLLCVGGNYVH